jgi:hypothetical protein
MSSFGESKAFKFIEDPETSLDFVKYNCRQISRIYPGAKRQDSSNLKVVPPWNAGCQIGKKKFMCVMVLRVVEFSSRGAKLEIFLPKNQHTQRKLLNFENWCKWGGVKN